MAIRVANRGPSYFIDAMRTVGVCLPDLAIAELGNQRVKDFPLRKMGSNKALLEFYGAEVVSFDQNGKDGALAVDLSTAFPLDNMEGHFHIVTNFGMGEHVGENQEQVFRTVHNLCRVGGVIVHIVPMIGTCKGHGVWKYSQAWFQWLAEFAGYDVLRIEDWQQQNSRRPHIKDDRMVGVLLQKSKSLGFPDIEWKDPPKK